MKTTINGVQYNEVKRVAKVGEKVKVVNAWLTGGLYSNGDVFTAKYVDGTLSVKEHDRALSHDEYVVLEPVATADTIVHDGVQYRKVDRPVREGDAFIVPKVSRRDYTAGKVYAVTKIGGGGDPHIIDDVGDRFYVITGNYYVLEPLVPSLSAIETELAATKAKVAEMEAQLAEAIAAQREKAKAEAQRLKVGDYAKVVQSGHGNFGKIVKITRDDRPGQYVYGTEHLNGDGADIHTPSQLTRATDEEITEAKRKLELHEIEAKWHAIGREVGEFKVGDVVKIAEYQCGHAEGSIVEVTSVYGNSVDVRGIHNRSFTTFGADKPCIELIAPVESVVNLRAGEAA
ncbi:hypothetical protein ACQKK5_08070 [Brevibacillus panacihumi]|uniref:hypothetical protein n=1 Tax=Brevibacillus panacihumi TaxID=497735 RepID=UPI003CFC53DE